MVPDNVLANVCCVYIQCHTAGTLLILQYMVRTMASPDELWRMRKQFALQVASCSFMTYTFSLSSRQPTRFQISRTTGFIAMTELLPGMLLRYQSEKLSLFHPAFAPVAAAHPLPVYASNDVVPFRLTPNMQNFLGPIFTEGILVSGIMAIGKALTEPEVGQTICSNTLGN